MSDAPERIWVQDAEPSGCNYTGGGWWDEKCGTVQYAHIVEYVRADLVDAKDARIAELEAVVNKLWRRQDSLDTFNAAVNEILTPLFKKQGEQNDG